MPYEMHQNAYALSNTEMLQHQTGNKVRPFCVASESGLMMTISI